MEATAGTSTAPVAVVLAASAELTPATAVLGLVDGVVVAPAATATAAAILAQQARVVVPVETTDRVSTAEPARAVVVVVADQRFHCLMLVVPARTDMFN